jgi:AcrR family transcriptional regulator
MHPADFEPRALASILAVASAMQEDTVSETRKKPSAPADARPREKKRNQRRDEILQVAAELFHEKGFHATGMDDIGAAAGITGPAIYRHFKSKDELLERLIIGNTLHLREKSDEIVRSASSQMEVLTGLVDLFVEMTLDDPVLAHLALFERRTLPASTRSTMERAERLFFEEWVHALTQVRSGLADAEARVMVHGASGIGFLSATYRTGLPIETLKALVREMMMAALLVERAATTSARPRSRLKPAIAF